MSAACRVSTEQPATAASTEFRYPSNGHLLITCPSQIFSWDSSGINTIFRSSKGGIVAAREAKDGSGVLAIADKQVVVLHDTKRGHEKSWGLEAERDEVRHLEYTADAKSLFLSTRLTADIQRYSTERSKMLHPANNHASPPVALAISPTGHAMLSASDHPPTAYLKNLAHNSSPVLIEPTVSKAPVCVIAFHPERANIFLMAFRDGSVAAYDSTRIGRHQGGQLADQGGISHGQISSFLKLHRATNETSKFASITGAAFLPGFKTRAITVGSDGRCRIVDFAGKGEVLRTWHAKAPVTSVSVLPLKDRESIKSPFIRNRASHTVGGPTSTESMIAIGRADGAVHLYDTVGILLEQKAFSDDGEKINSLEWVKGPSPRPIPVTTIGEGASQAPSITANSPRRKTTVHVSPTTVQTGSAEQAADSRALPTRQFTIHPDEADEGTVRHTPMPGQSQVHPASNGAYLDLFSPAKPAEPKAEDTNKRRVASPGRSRPRISSQTFAKSPIPAPTAEDSKMARPRNIAVYPSAGDTDDAVSPNDNTVSASTKSVPPVPHQRVTWRPSERRRSRKSVGSKTLPGQANNNAKVLAELRKMSTVRPTEQVGGVLAAFRPTGIEQGSSKDKRAGRGLLRRPAEHIDTDLESLDALEEYENTRRERKWVVDSEQDGALGDDIWLTSESGDDTTRRARREKPTAVERPPARQTSRSRITSKGTVSTAGKVPVLADVSMTLRSIDGSTEEDGEGMQTARSQVSASGNFSPSSNDVRQLFPRTSSLSPHKHKSKTGTPANRSRRRKDPIGTERKTLREMTLNTAHVRQANSPWAKMKASKASAAPQSHIQSISPPCELSENTARVAGTDGTSEEENAEPESHCAICGPTQTRVVGLEGEVARLRGEVLALKAVLRRNGLQVPKMH